MPRINVRRNRGRPRSGGLKRVTRKGVKRAVRQYTNRVFRARVKSVIRSTAETKFYSIRWTKLPTNLQAGNTSLNGNIAILTPPGAGDANTYSAPVINQGTKDGERVGNRIRIKKAMLNISAWPEPYGAGTNPTPRPQVVRLFFFRTKVNQMTVPSAVALQGTGGNFFQNGTDSSGLIGNIMDMNMLLNKDRYIYLGHKTFKLGFSTLQGTGGDTLNYQYANNDFKYSYFKRINITKYVSKEFTWDDLGNTTTPYTYCLMQTVPADGSTLALGNIPCKVSGEQYYEYNDI